MKNIIKLSVAVLSLFVVNTVFAANSAVGYWKTIDDVTGKPKAIVQIWESNNHTLMGRILKIWPRPGFDQNEVCSACTGENHNKRIVGMVILQGLRQKQDQPNVWSDGTILDPKSGKIYHSYLQVTGDGQALHVRGYIGIPLFGRSQTWVRVNSANSD